MISFPMICFLITAFMLLQSTCLFSPSCNRPNCQMCSGSACVDCPPGLTCCQSSCAICNNQTQCSACSFGYSHNSLLMICERQESCLQPSCLNCINNYCQDCLPGFVLDAESHQCIICPSSCSLCTVDGNCIACDIGYFLSGGVCQSCLNFGCEKCNNMYECVKCLPGYVIEYNLAFCTSCPNNCLYCVVQGSCTVCSNSYYLTNNRKCHSCSTSCENCVGSATNCSSCSNSAVLIQGTCRECFIFVPFCLACTLNGTSVICLSCTEGMVGVGSTCQLCPENCAACSTPINCTSCRLAYYLSNNSLCYPCFPNCSSCTNSTVCLGCTPNFYISTNSSSCLACPANCKSCSNSSNCQNCLSGYYSSSGICLSCSLNCEQCLSSILCTACAIGFFGMKINSIRMCVPCPLYCANCIPEGCFQCSPTFLQVGGICIPCPISNCFDCLAVGNSTSCKLCSRGYFLSTSKAECLPCPPGCSICQNSTYCITCAAGSYQSNGSCLACFGSCSICLDSQSCLKCMLGFYLGETEPFCFPCSTGCHSCQSPADCTSCTLSYYLNASIIGTTCQKCMSPCRSCSSPTACTSCVSGYTLLSSGLCSSCPSGCLTCHDQQCVDCLDGYALTYANKSLSCTPCPIGCVRCESTLHHILNKATIICVQCPHNWILLNNQSCILCGSTPQTQGCSTCKSNGECTKCFDEFVLTDKNSCTNANQEIVMDPPKALIGSCIGLGCAVMILLALLLYLKLSPTAHRA